MLFENTVLRVGVLLSNGVILLQIPEYPLEWTSRSFRGFWHGGIDWNRPKSETCEGFTLQGDSYSHRLAKTPGTMRQNADKKLADRLLNGDQQSFDTFFNTYFPRIYRFALLRLNHDHNLAEDTAQNVLCQAISRMSSYRGEAPLFSWLCTFCRYEISKQRKARGRAQGEAHLTEDDPAVRAALESLLSASGNDPDVAAYQAELSQLVKVTLDHLPALYADSLECKYVHGHSVRDIATRIGKSEKATESILTRARAAFQVCFSSLALDEHGNPNTDTRLSSVFE